MIPTIWKSESPRVRSYPILSLFDEMNRLLDDSTSGIAWSDGSKKLANFAPKIDITETPTEFTLTGEFPGMEEKDINIELKDNTLTLSGEKRFEAERKEGHKSYVERSFGSFMRTFPFNVEVDEDNSTATMKNGVLSIKVPKSAKTIKGAKKLSIKAG